MQKVFILGFLLTLLSCEESSKQVSILGIKAHSHCQNNSPCRVEFSKILDDPWDKFYIFKESASLEFINEILGFNYPFFQDVGKRFVFVKDNSIVYHEDIFPSVEFPYDFELIFTLPDSMKYASFTPQTAIFEITENKLGRKTILKAHPISKRKTY